MARHLFTSESVTEGHPDKICDQISDAILDEILTNDPDARVACETCASTGLVHIMGEITTNCYVDFQKIVREVVSEIGYTRAKYGFDADTCAVISNIDGQSPDIALGTNDQVGGAITGYRLWRRCGAGVSPANCWSRSRRRVSLHREASARPMPSAARSETVP